MLIHTTIHHSTLLVGAAAPPLPPSWGPPWQTSLWPPPVFRACQHPCTTVSRWKALPMVTSSSLRCCLHHRSQWKKAWSAGAWQSWYSGVPNLCRFWPKQSWHDRNWVRWNSVVPNLLDTQGTTEMIHKRKWSIVVITTALQLFASFGHHCHCPLMITESFYHTLSLSNLYTDLSSGLHSIAAPTLLVFTPTEVFDLPRDLLWTAPS